MQDPEGDRDPSHLLGACNDFHRRHIDPFLKELVPNGIPRSSATEGCCSTMPLPHTQDAVDEINGPLAVTVPLTDSPCLTRSPYSCPSPSLLFFRGLPFLQPR